MSCEPRMVPDSHCGLQQTDLRVSLIKAVPIFNLSFSQVLERQAFKQFTETLKLQSGFKVHRSTEATQVKLVDANMVKHAVGELCHLQILQSVNWTEIRLMEFIFISWYNHDQAIVPIFGVFHLFIHNTKTKKSKQQIVDLENRCSSEIHEGKFLSIYLVRFSHNHCLLRS